MMGQSSTNLAALIGSRICHDLISPIGAINNGLELLGMSGGTPGPEMDLIQESVGNASARIRFFRIAFGAAGEQMMGRAEVVSILNDLMDGARLEVAWGPMDAQPRASVRLAFLALLCVESAMPYGGRVEISQSEGNWLLHGRADKLNVVETQWSLLATKEIPADLRPAHVQFALLPLIAADDSRRIVTELSEAEVKLRF
jgi:histidine phosphotransferase ChpT